MGRRNGQKQQKKRPKGVERKIPPAVPVFEELEHLAARTEPKPAGAWWITLQSANYIVESGTERDVHTGESHPRPLIKVLRAIGKGMCVGPRPVPNDRTYRAALLSFDALRKIVRAPRTRLLREHRQRSLHSIRELDVRCMNWLARLPGRNVREKLSGRVHTLAVVRRFSSDTWENRIVKRVLELLEQRLEERFKYIDSYNSGNFERIQRELLDFCYYSLRGEVFGEVGVIESPRPNNVLINDRNYSRIWRTWMLLDDEEDAFRAGWDKAEERYLNALFLAVAGTIARDRNISVVQQMVLPEVDRVEPDKIVISAVNEEKLGRIDLLMPMAENSKKKIRRAGRSLYASREVKLVTVERSEHEVCISVRRLTAQPSVKGRKIGCVKSIIKSGQKSYGFICDSSGNEFYFNPHGKGNSKIFHSLASGDYVSFTAGMKFRTGKSPAHNIKCISMGKPGLRAAFEQKIGTARLSLGFDKKKSEQSYFQVGRGFPVFVKIRDNGGKLLKSKRVPADIGGMNETIVDALSCSGLKEKAKEADAKAEEKNKDVLGVDLLGGFVFICGNSGTWSTETLPYALYCEKPTKDFIWQVGTRHRIPCFGGPEKIYRLDRSLSSDNSGDESVATTGCHKIVRALASEVREKYLGDTSFVVPDGLDEFSQQTLRAAMSGAFSHSIPVVRSIAAALAWQERDDFRKLKVKDGDVVLVLCAEAEALTFTLLVARYDRKLKEERPESGGIFWERRPAIPVEEYCDGLGLLELWSDYAQHLIEANFRKLWKNKGDSYKAQLVSFLLDSGVLRETVESGSVHWIRDCDRWLVLDCVEKLLKGSLDKWRGRFATAMKSGLGQLIFSALPNSRRCSILLVGPPFNNKFVFDSVRDTIQKGGIGNRTGESTYISSETGEISVGAFEFMRRIQAGLPVWRDWLPDLFLEVVKDGLYSELELISGKSVDVKLGSVHTVDVAKSIVLQEGKPYYEFSLVAGRANRRPVPVDLRLESSVFPLIEDVPVQLRIQYRYGVENSYNLSVIPQKPGSAPFERIEALCSNPGSGAEVPDEKLRLPEPVCSCVSFDEWYQKKSDILEALDNLENQINNILEDNCWDVGDEIKRYATPRIRWLTRQLVSCSVLAASSKSKHKQAASFQHKVVTGELVKLLVEVVGVNFNNRWEGPVESVDKYILSDFREAALGFLCSLGRQVPKQVIKWLRKMLKSEDHAAGAPQSIAYAIDTLYRADSRRNWIDELWNKVITKIQPFENPQLYGQSVGVLAKQAWNDPEFISTFAQRIPEFVPVALRVIERGIRAIASKAAQSIEPNSEVKLLGGHIRGFEDLCELTLALLRLRGTSFGSWLEIGIPRMVRLAKLVRMTDSLIVRSKPKKEVKNHLKLKVSKPDELYRVSALAYAVNSFLLGFEDSNFIRIEAVPGDYADPALRVREKEVRR